MKQLVWPLLFAYFASSCGSKKDSGSTNGGSTGTDNSSTISCTPLKATTEEPEYCGTESSHSGQTLSGTATFQARKVNSIGLGSAGSAEKIRFAEVHVYNSSGTRVQCSETDTNGNFSFRLPATAGNYEVRVFSRANNSNLKVSVLQDPTNNQPHYISTTVTSDGSTSSLAAGTINAPATGDMEGGAFNIYDQVLKTNEFLKTYTAGCSADCKPITVADKSKFYWKKGFNPSSYFGRTEGLSFFSKCDDALFILGGLNNDTDRSDTDHFDNSIIIHEYGHFIENTYAGTDTPGGAHSGNEIIDPRLAWGEGWANFLQAAVTGQPEYIDTHGNISGSTMFIFKENIETPSKDIPLMAGEGNFREFSISRGLWDMIDPHPVSSQGTNEGSGVDEVTVDFSSLWSVFTGEFSKSSTHFRNYGLFFEKLTALESSKDFSSILTGEKQKASQEDYARKITKGGSCSDYTIVGRVNPHNSSLSDMFASNDYFQYEHPGGELNVELVYQPNSTSNRTDLDLYVYYESYIFGQTDASSLVGLSFDNAPADGGTENVKKTVAAGFYMIVVNNAEASDIPLGAGASYQINIDGEKACP